MSVFFKPFKTIYACMLVCLHMWACIYMYTHICANITHESNWTFYTETHYGIHASMSLLWVNVYVYVDSSSSCSKLKLPQWLDQCLKINSTNNYSLHYGQWYSKQWYDNTIYYWYN